MASKRDDGLRSILQGKDYDQLRERIGRDWLGACAYVSRCDPRTEVLIKSISIRVHPTGCFVVLRGRFGANDVVMMREAGRLEWAISYISYMVHKGKWKPDKYGVQSSLEDLSDDLSGRRDLNKTDTV